MITINGAAYARMADSINPSALPAGMDAYLGYVDGRWPDYQQIAAAHGGVPVYGLTVTANGWAGDGTDTEPGDGTIADAVAATRVELARGIARPIKYCPLSWAQQLVDAHTADSIPRSSYRLLTAHYGAGQHICTPACGYRFTGTADGSQWIDHGTWDESLLLPSFTAATPHPGPPPAAPAPFEIGDLMHVVPFEVTRDPAGWTAIAIPLPAGTTAANVVNVRCEGASAYDPQSWQAADGYVDASQPAAGQCRIIVRGPAGRFFTGRAYVSATT